MPAIVDDVPIGVDEASRDQDDFAPHIDIFKLEKSMNYLKPLHMKGYINGKPINNMLVNRGAMVNLML